MQAEIFENPTTGPGIEEKVFRKGKMTINIEAGDHPRVNGRKTLRRSELSSCPSFDRLSVGRCEQNFHSGSLCSGTGCLLVCPVSTG